MQLFLINQDKRTIGYICNIGILFAYDNKNEKMKKNRTKFLSFLFIVFVFTTAFILKQEKVNNYVPDAETAKKIAEAIWLPIYGKDVLTQKPYETELKDGIWIVKGVLKDELGGTAYIEIQKSDCKILKVTHGK